MRTIARFMDARNTTEGKFLSVLLSVLWGCGRFFVPSYAAQPSLRRYSPGLSHPSERLILPEQ